MTDLPAYLAAAQAQARHAAAAKRWRSGLAIAAAQSAVATLERFGNDPAALERARANLAAAKASGPAGPFPGFAR